MSDELHCDASVGCEDTIGTCPFVGFNSFDGTVRCAGLFIRADGIVPLVASVAVLVPAGNVSPPPVHVESDCALLRLAITRTIALGELHGNMVLLLLGADILCEDGSQ